MGIIRKFKSLFRPGNLGIKREIQRLLVTDSPVIIEAGAHIGTDTIEMNKIWPSGIIHAFEPIPTIYNKLVRNIEGRKNIFTHPLALSNQTGSAEIFVSSGGSDGSSSLLAPQEHTTEHPNVKFENKIKINTITIDEWASINKIERVDFLWLDMQGHELTALKSGASILRTVRVIYMEVFLKQLYAGAPLYDEVKTWLNEQGFEVEKEEMDWASVGNVLFVRK